MDPIIEKIHINLFMGVATLFFFQAIILFVRSRDNKVRRALALIDLVWGTMYGIALILIQTTLPSSEFSLFREKVLILGSYFITITHFFPIQALAPGWLNAKRMLLLLSPNIAMTVIYYGGLFLLNESSEDLVSYAVFGASIGHFNVWFRFVILLGNIVYMALIFWWLHGYEKKYLHWKEENFSDQEYVDISWMHSYYYIIMGISLLYLGVLFIGGRIPTLCHSLFVVLSFSYLFYKILFYESPYPQDFFDQMLQKPYNHHAVDKKMEAESVWQDENDQPFEEKIPEYTVALKRWMEKEKPFVDHDFKLADISVILPLNRSYLSRLVNEGFGQNFSEVVRLYRVHYSMSLMKDNPAMPIAQVADMCGFRSDITFVRAFRLVAKMTPSEYKAEHLKE